MREDMVVHFVDICGYNHHCLKFLFANFIIFCTYSGLWEYIEQTREEVTELETSVQKAKDNVEEIVKLISTWSKTPLFERKEDKYDTLLNLDDRQDRLEKRYGCIEEIGTKIHELIQVWFLAELQRSCSRLMFWRKAGGRILAYLR